MSHPPSTSKTKNGAQSFQERAHKPGGLSREEALRRAEQAIENLDINYPEVAAPKVKTIFGYIVRMTKGETLSPEDQEAMYRESHDIKGQGGSFGYPLLSEIAASLCVCIEHGNKENTHYIAILNNHITALKLILEKNIKGAGGKAEQELIKTIQEVTNKIRTD